MHSLNRNVYYLGLGLVLACFSVTAVAQTTPTASPGMAPSPQSTEAALAQEVLTAKPIPAEIFAASLLASISAGNINSVRDQTVAPMGAFVSISGSNGKYVGTFVHGQVTVLIHVDSDGKIDGLLLRNPILKGVSLPETLASVRNLPGSVSYVIEENGRELQAFNQSQALGVGSTFKLAVLNALRQQIDRGKQRWSDVVQLKAGWKSLPSGVYQTWPDGTALTLQTLATEMISVSDNTAADALASIVGHSAIAPFAGTNDPFLTTREMFTLKSAEGASLRARYLHGTPAERRAVVMQIDRMPLPSIDDLDTDPSLASIEWHYTNRQLCRLMAGVQDLPLMSVNPGVASPSQWQRIAYKGGSDWGVISMTTWLVSRAGDSYCVSVSWNDTAAAVDQDKFETLYGSVLSSLATP